MFTAAGEETVAHGGDLGVARRLFPGAPEPFIDLSTGINPWSYPLGQFSAAAFARLPEQDALTGIAAAAAKAYGVPSAGHVVVAPGSQILLPLVASLMPPARATVVSPTYPGLARAASLAGHDVRTVESIEQAGDAKLVILANPNNPDGRCFTRTALLKHAHDLRRRGGLLVVDEAFMEVAPPGRKSRYRARVRQHCRSALLRQILWSSGTAIGICADRAAAGAPAGRGNWPLAGLGARARHWNEGVSQIRPGSNARGKTWRKRRRHLMRSWQRRVWRLSAAPTCSAWFEVRRRRPCSEHLGRAGIYVRTFPDNRTWLRFGLPAHAVRAEALEKGSRGLRPDEIACCAKTGQSPWHSACSVLARWWLCAGTDAAHQPRE